MSTIKDFLNEKELDKIIVFYGFWKVHLKNNICEGCGIDINELNQDYSCDFGKWLYNIPLELLVDENFNHYTKVKELHSKAHEIAVSIARLILNNQTEKAKEEITNGDFFYVSTKLVVAILDWKKYINAN